MRQFLWNVYRKETVGDHTFERYLCSVESDSAGHACDVACAVTMTSRLSLCGYPDESDSRKGDWPEWAPRLIALGERKMGRPSQGRSARLQAAITPDLQAWLESQRQPDEKSISEVAFRLLEKLRTS